MANKVIWVRPEEKAAFRLFISKHHQETGVELKEWEAMKMLLEECKPAILKEAIALMKANGGKTKGK